MLRRRRLDPFRDAPDWPGKAVALAAEQARYDHWLLVAADILDVPVPEATAGPGDPLPSEVRAVLEDRLAQAGLDVFTPRTALPPDVLADDEPISF